MVTLRASPDAPVHLSVHTHPLYTSLATHHPTSVYPATPPNESPFVTGPWSRAQAGLICWDHSGNHYSCQSICPDLFLFPPTHLCPYLVVRRTRTKRYSDYKTPSLKSHSADLISSGQKPQPEGQGHPQKSQSVLRPEDWGLQRWLIA